MPRQLNVDDIKVEGGKLKREIDPARLDEIIARQTNQLSKCDDGIAALQQQKVEIQARLTKLNALKAQL